MKLASVEIENYRAIDSLDLPLDPQMTVLFGPNGCGKTSVLTAIAMALAVGAESDYQRLALDRRVGAANDPVIRLRGARSPEDEGSGQRRSVVLHVLTEQMPAYPLSIPLKHDISPWELASLGMGVPLARFYDINRAVVSSLTGREVGSKPDYEQLFEWFHAMEYRELRARRETGRDEEIGDLSAVRTAICRMLQGVSDPRVGMSDPPRLVVSREGSGSETTLAFEQLSDGYRGVLALAADIARHLARGAAGESTNALHREVVVLIDEIELHLHPAWQQRILTDLTRTFPNAQFIVSTHSPQVLTTVHPKHIVELAIEDGRVVAGAPPISTYGAEAGYVLSGLMGVDQRPDNEFTTLLAQYMSLIADDRGETDEAVGMRTRLERLGPGDPALDRADFEIRRRGVLRNMDRS